MSSMVELLIAELDREAVGTCRTLERIPEGSNEWTPPGFYGPSADEK